MIHLTDNSQVFDKHNNWLWLVSAFESGFVNSTGLLITGQYVSHVTGYATMVGVAMTHESFIFGIELMVIPISFILGGTLTSLILDRKRPEGKVPPYHLVQALITALLMIILFLSHWKNQTSAFPFGADETFSPVELIIVGLLCLACGLKNSLMAWSTWGKIRVTHLTGLSTDIGLNLPRLFNRKWKSIRFDERRTVNVIRILMFLSFSAGAMLCAFLFPWLQHASLLVIVGVSGMMTLYSFFARLELHRRVRQLARHKSTKISPAKDLTSF